jgi:ankyrin repeat protein
MRVMLFVLAFGLAANSFAASSLFEAIAAKDVSAVEQILSSGEVNVDSRARDGATPLIAAALSDQPAIADLLLNKGADLKARNSGGFTPLHAAAYSGSVAIAKMLLDKGAVLEDAGNKAGVTPLLVAGEENHLALAEMLIARGANITHTEIHGYLPITRAIWKGNWEIVRLFKLHGATCPPANVLGSEAMYLQCNASK